MSTRSCEVAVIGLGAAGSAALSALARAGVAAVGFDRFAPPHDRGSSHGETRLLRTAYSEGAFYVPLVKRAIVLWRQLERRTGAALFEQTGVTYAGPRDDPFMLGAHRSGVRMAKAGGLERWFDIPDDWERLTDVAGGFVRPERAIAAMLDDARAQGAQAWTNRRCLGLERRRDGIALRFARQTVLARQVIVTTGAWVRELLPELKRRTYVERRVLHWFADTKRRFAAGGGFKPFALATGHEQLFYGFPANADGLVKVGEHDTVEIIDGPERLNRRIAARDVAAIVPLVKRFMPGLGAHMRSQVCMYPMAKDERFVLAPHPREPRIIIGAGLSGHGFKFAPAIGEVLANLALGRAQRVETGAFSYAGTAP